jgi:RND family efflux transporter MFP subunit
MNEIINTEDQMRAEIEELKRQLEQQKLLAAHTRARSSRPTFRTFLVVVLLLAALAAAGYYYGYAPRQRREMVLAAESQNSAASLPVVNVVSVKRSEAKTSLVLPGNIQAVTEAPVLARASGYIQKRYVDIGDRVTAGQPLAEIEAPELAQQIRQARAAVEQTASAVEQAQASLEQGRSNENLARVTHERWDNLFKRGVVSRQENDTYAMQYAAQQANVQALEKAVNAARSNGAAAQANLDRLLEIQSYLTVRAPFAGVITVRNIDTGVLVNEGNTLLYRVAQTDRLRTYVNVPQSESDSVRIGQQATLTIADLGDRKFSATVARTANALDPATRTLLVELQVGNSAGVLLPGMYAQVDFSIPRLNPPLVIPGDTLVVRSAGPQVGVIAADGAVHFQNIELGRDFGDRLEVLSGLEEGQHLVVNPGDAIQEGVKVKAAAPEKPEQGKKS